MNDQFYSYDPEDGYSEHDSEDAAEKAAERALSGYRGDADEHGWPDGVEAIHWGRLLPLGESKESHGTGDDGEPWTDYHLATQPDELAQLRAQVATLTAERDKARADYAYVVERAADQRLDGYRELGARAAAAENERDALRARVAELEAHELAVALATGIAHEPSMGPCYPGPRGEVVAEIERLRREARDAYECRARIATLESPPVVPEGWEVSCGEYSWGLLNRHGYAVEADEMGITETSIDSHVPWAAIRALAWAIEHDQRPPHAGEP